MAYPKDNCDAMFYFLEGSGNFSQVEQCFADDIVDNIYWFVDLAVVDCFRLLLLEC